MPAFKCRMCGGDLEAREGETVAECPYCRSTQTLPTADDEAVLRLYARAGRLLRACEFDKAAGVYEQVVAARSAEAEAYWGLVLCRYGIEYVEDPATAERRPTCHRSSFDSVMDDEDFELACEYADGAARAVYRDKAKEVERIRRRIVEVSGAEEPYDVFLCYKETDPATGQRTIDSVLAQDVYDALAREGYRTFFSRVTLEDKLGTDYEPYIFAALNSARVMLVLGTDYDHFDAVWVKNEWSRFLRLMERDPSKHLIPCYRGIDAYDMPPEFARLQGQDLGKVGALQDLMRGIGKLVGRKSQDIGGTKHQREPQQAAAAMPQTGSLLKRSKMFLEDGNWESADEYAERVLDLDPECAEAYLCKLMAKLKVQTEDQLSELPTPFDGKDIVLLSYGDQKISVISAVLKITGLSLKEAKSLVESCPVVLPVVLTDELAYAQTARALEIAGATITPSPGEKPSSSCKLLYDKVVRFGSGDLVVRIEAANVAIRNRNRKAAEKKAAAEKAAALAAAEKAAALAAAEKAAALAAAEKRRKEAVSKTDYDAIAEAYRTLDGCGGTSTEAQDLADEWTQIERRAEKLCDCYVPPKREDTTSLGEKVTSLEALRNGFPEAKAARDDAEKGIAQTTTERKNLEAERSRLGLFQSARKRAIAAELERLARKETELKKARNSAQTKMGGYEDNALLDADIAAAREAVRMREAERIEALAPLRAALSDPKALLHAESLKRGMLDSMEGDPAVWPLVRRTPYLYELTDESKKKERQKQRDDLLEGRFQMGEWRHAPLKWRMLKEEGGRALLVCSEVIGEARYSNTRLSSTWEKSRVRKWLNSEFLESAFSVAEQDRIAEVAIDNPGNERYGTSGGAAIRDKVFCLSIDEAEKLFKDPADRKCKHIMADDEKCFSWWLRSPGRKTYSTYEPHSVSYVFRNGIIITADSSEFGIRHGIRPAFWLNL